MATALRLDGLTRLRRLDSEATELARRVGGLLEAGGLTVSVLHTVSAGFWFSCSDGVLFRLRSSPPLHEERVAEAVAALDSAEPLLAAAEQALGLALEPAGMIEGEPEESIVLAFEADGRAGEIALPVHHPRRSDWEAEARALPPSPAMTPVTLRITVQGPRLAICEAGDLAPGDLVLIGARPAATIETEAAGGLAGQLDLASGSFTPHPQGAPMADDSPGPARDFAVPLTLRLPDRMTSAASLAELRPGMTLPLGPLTDGMPVELLVAGRPLARGELVQLGDRFAVLIEERAVIADEPVPGPAESDAETEASAAEARA